MGIRFIDSILSFLAVCCVVFSAYFIGHALSSEHGGWAWMTAAILAVLGAALVFLAVRRIRDYGRRYEAHGHSH